MRLIPWLLLPVALIVLVGFAIANRTAITISLDPLPFEWQARLFVVVFLAIGLGIVVGGSATWVAQRRWRRLARERRRANEALQRELAAGRPALPAKTP